MLKVYHELAGKNVSSKSFGDANSFLRSVLVEVATENYRQLMFEGLALGNSDSDKVFRLDPPLRANERVISGLFANAIARVSPRSRPEARIDRPELQLAMESLESDLLPSGQPKSRAGRVDFLAWYGQRIFAIELKAAAMNCEQPQLTRVVRDRWEEVVTQAKTAQTHLLKLRSADRNRYPNPASLAVMVVVGRRAKLGEKASESNDKLETLEGDFMQALAGLRPAPTFRALYTFPEEFRALQPRKRGHAVTSNAKAIYTPFVAFLASAAVRGAV